MKLAILEHSVNGLQVLRLNTAYIADLKHGVKFWAISVIFFGAFHFLTVALNIILRYANSAAISVFPSVTQMLLLGAAAALIVAVNLLPDSGLLYSETFSFDWEKNAFSVNNRAVTGLDKITVHLQDGFGPSRRAFRIIVTAWGKSHVVAQTPRFTVATLVGMEYPSVVTSEGMQKKYSFNQWADYAGAKTGFSSKWPEYQEVFALHDELAKLVNTSKIVHEAEIKV